MPMKSNENVLLFILMRDLESDLNAAACRVHEIMCLYPDLDFKRYKTEYGDAKIYVEVGKDVW